MSMTSLALRGVFPIDGRNMKNQTSSYSMYEDDESPIDLTKKPVISRQKGSEIGDRGLPVDTGATSPEASEDEHEKRSEFFHAIQKMSAMAVPPFINPLWMVNPKQVDKMDGLPNPGYGGGAAGYHRFPMPNPYVINPLSLANLYPFVSEQYGVGYAMVNSPDGAHVVPVPFGLQRHAQNETTESRDLKVEKSMNKSPLCELKKTQTVDGIQHERRAENTVDRTEGIKSYDRCNNDQSSVSNRCASTPPDSDYVNHRKLKGIRHLRDTWRSDSRLLASKAPFRSKSRFAGGGSLDQAILRLHCSKQKLPTQPMLVSQKTPSKTYLARSLSCSDLSKIDRCDSNRNAAKFRYHSGYGSDNEIMSSSSLSSSQSSLKSLDWSKKADRVYLGPYKRKSAAASDDSDIENAHSPQPSGNYTQSPNRFTHDDKRLKGLRSLSEPSIRNKIASSPIDYASPTDLSMKTSPTATPLSIGDAENYLRQLGHMSPGGIPWNVYGYYNHLMQRFQDQEMLKRHLGLNISKNNHHHRETPLPSAGEAGLSPPPSPPENYSSLTSSGGWLDSSPLEDRCRAGTPDEGISTNDPNNKKRPSRALTGKHVKHGTGASPSTLITLRQKIEERQKAKELGIRPEKGCLGYKTGSMKTKPNQHKKPNAQRLSVNRKDRPKHEQGETPTS